MPARQASVPRLVGDDLMPSAVALSQMQCQVTGIVGPALAGVLIAATGSPGWAYAVDLVSYAAMLIAAVAMKPLPPLASDDAPSVGRTGGGRGVPLRARTIG